VDDTEMEMDLRVVVFRCAGSLSTGSGLAVLNKDLGMFNKIREVEAIKTYEEGAVVREILRGIGRFLGLNNVEDEMEKR
jgi:hypothetical protein